MLFRAPVLPSRTKWLWRLSLESKRTTDKAPPLDDVVRDPNLLPNLKE